MGGMDCPIEFSVPGLSLMKALPPILKGPRNNLPQTDYCREIIAIPSIIFLGQSITPEKQAYHHSRIGTPYINGGGLVHAEGVELCMQKRARNREEKEA
jgi:hypothetical protein